MQRNNLSTEVAAIIRDLILNGELAAGERLNEVHLAERIEVSRTPLREALSLLATEDFLLQQPRRGYFVRGLSLDEFDGVYGMRAILDPAALRMAGLPSQSQTKELHRLNAAIRKAKNNPTRVIELDDAWHMALIDHCPNRVLLETIQHFMLRTRRYEHDYMRSAVHVDLVLTDHDEILAALGDNDLHRACEGLRANMESACEPVRQWLKEREV